MMDDFGTCKRCGEKHFIGTDGLCPVCRRDDHALMELEDGETEFTGEDEARCPWCAKRVHLDDISPFGDGTYTCPHCGKRYAVNVEAHFTYDTKRVMET